MGSFSFIRADHCIKQKNLVLGDSYKILIPKKLGGGYIKDKYWDYGYINHYHNAVYYDEKGNKTPLREVEGDLYGLLAWFNCPKELYYVDVYPLHILDILVRGCTQAQDNRLKGISIGCHDEDIDKLKYPLKLVSVSCKDTYETCKYRTYGDPEQGFKRTYWGYY